jgi:hypothetical protein
MRQEVIVNSAEVTADDVCAVVPFIEHKQKHRMAFALLVLHRETEMLQAEGFAPIWVASYADWAKRVICTDNEARATLANLVKEGLVEYDTKKIDGRPINRSWLTPKGLRAVGVKVQAAKPHKAPHAMSGV